VLDAVPYCLWWLVIIETVALAAEEAHEPHRTIPRGLVWAHGGGFIAGDLDMPETDVVARELAERANMVVVAVAYKLCVPMSGVHFPVPHDDVHAAFLWAATTSNLLAPGAPWSLGGGSAGGNLAAGVGQRLRDEGGVVPDALVLAYPVVHDPVPDSDDEHLARVATLPAVLRFPVEARGFLNKNFLGENDSDVPYAFAGMGNVDDLPRTRVIVCEFDDLAPSGELFARQLRDAGVEVELEVVPGVPHGHLNIQGLPEALHSIEEIGTFLTRGTA
jgi:acetyl esterase/lipase